MHLEEMRGAIDRAQVDHDRRHVERLVAALVPALGVRLAAATVRAGRRLGLGRRIACEHHVRAAAAAEQQDRGRGADDRGLAGDPALGGGDDDRVALGRLDTGVVRHTASPCPR
jgi:hypothetical protein